MMEEEEKAKMRTILETFNNYYELTMREDNVQEKDKSLKILEELLKALQALHNYVTKPWCELINLTKFFESLMFYFYGSRFDIPQVWKDKK